MNIDCVALHSVLSQMERVQALGKFKSRYVRVLIATDVASRGLDIPAGGWVRLSNECCLFMNILCSGFSDQL